MELEMKCYTPSTYNTIALAIQFRTGPVFHAMANFWLDSIQRTVVLRRKTKLHSVL